MKELSIFIDESGDWGEYEKHCPYYIVTMEMHDQSKDIEKEVRHLEEHLRYIGCENQCIHAVPIIRGEHQYKYYEPETRRNLLKDMMYFIRHVDIIVDKMGVKVIAPSDTVWAHSDGKLTIGPKSYINNGKWVEFNPRKRGKG